MVRGRAGALSLAVAIGLAVAACGGGSGTPTQAPATSGAGGPTAAPPTQAGTATEAPIATVVPVATSGGGGGGGTANTACDLITGEEAGAVLGLGALTASGGEAMGQTYCNYDTADGTNAIATYMQKDAAQIWQVWEASLQTEPVSGIGDKAMYERSTKLLFVLKGGTFFNVFVATLGLSEDEALEQEKKLAQIMVGRA